MSDVTDTKVPTWFMVVAGLALLWNLMGVAVYLGQVMISPEALAALPTDQQAVYAAFPAWATGAFALAVFAGTLGCVGLLLKMRWAMPLLIVSFVCALAQNVYWLFMSNAPQVYGTEVYFMPALVTVIGAALIWFARFAAHKNWMH